MSSRRAGTGAGGTGLDGFFKATMPLMRIPSEDSLPCFRHDIPVVFTPEETEVFKRAERLAGLRSETGERSGRGGPFMEE